MMTGLPPDELSTFSKKKQTWRPTANFKGLARGRDYVSTRQDCKWRFLPNLVLLNHRQRCREGDLPFFLTMHQHGMGQGWQIASC